jgi:hypothetical protein
MEDVSQHWIDPLGSGDQFLEHEFLESGGVEFIAGRGEFG